MKSPHSTVLALAALASVPLTGCVERKITIASDPPGALIYVNDVEVGHTPLTVPFLWYGNYDVRANLDKNVGTLDEPKIIQYSYHGSREATAPIYQWLGIDLVAELLPIHFVDKKIWVIALLPAPQPTDDQLVKSGLELKTQLNSNPDLKRPQESKAAPGKPSTLPASATQPAATQKK